MGELLVGLFGFGWELDHNHLHLMGDVPHEEWSRLQMIRGR